MSDVDKFQEGVKLVVLYQAALEQMDTFKDTALYRQSVKQTMQRLEKDLESLIQGPIANLDSINSDLFTRIQMAVEIILDLTIPELSQLKLAVKEVREEDLQEWQEEILDKEIK